LLKLLLILTQEIFKNQLDLFSLFGKI